LAADLAADLAAERPEDVRACLPPGFTAVLWPLLLAFVADPRRVVFTRIPI